MKGPPKTGDIQKLEAESSSKGTESEIDSDDDSDDDCGGLFGFSSVSDQVATCED